MVVDGINNIDILRDVILTKNSGVQNETTIAAVKKIKNDKVLFDLLKMVTPRLMVDIASNINDQEMLKEIIDMDVNTEVKDQALMKRVNPSYQECLKIDSKFASKKLTKIIEGMKYPDNKDELFEIARTSKDDDVVAAALDKIPTEKEKEKIMNLIASSNSDFAKEYAISETPIDKHEMLITYIMNNKTASMPIKKAAAKVLSTNKIYASREVCPYCGYLDSVKYFSSKFVPSNDMYYEGYKCNICGHEKSIPEGMGGIKDFTVTISDFAKN